MSSRIAMSLCKLLFKVVSFSHPSVSAPGSEDVEEEVDEDDELEDDGEDVDMLADFVR